MEAISAAEARKLLSAKAKRKYRNEPVTIDGFRFDSKAEAGRYGSLLMAQRAGMISNLEVHPRIELRLEGRHIGWYRADFSYDRDGVHVVEDVKSEKTRKLSGWARTKRLFRACYGFEITEVIR